MNEVDRLRKVWADAVKEKKKAEDRANSLDEMSRKAWDDHQDWRHREQKACREFLEAAIKADDP